MPVPSSYNDITRDPKIRDHIGVAWYQKCAYLPQNFIDMGKRIVLQFGSVNYHAMVVSIDC
jgi:beta-glucuronidase